MSNKILTKQQAIEALDNGKRLSHKSFTDGEWIEKGGKGIICEDGHSIESDVFWSGYRNHPDFSKDWYIVEKEKSTEQALEWWESLPLNYNVRDYTGSYHRDFLCKKYYGSRWLGTLTDREIEEIWRKEVSHNNSDVDEHFSKLNQKQYTERDLELAYCIGYLNQRDFSMDLLFKQSKELKHKFNLCKKFIDDQKV